jgi:hypothetical protein
MLYTKNLFVAFILLTNLTSCVVKEKYEEFKQIQNELKSSFSNHDLEPVIGWSSEDGYYAYITFYHYNLESASFQDLKKLAEQATKNLLTSKSDFTIVRVVFTEEDYSETPKEFVEFRTKEEIKEE